MFRITRKSSEGFDIVTLEDPETGCFAEIIPSCSALLHSYGIKNNSIDLQVIESYKSKQQFITQAEPLGFRGCKLSPFACRIKDSTYNFGNEKFVLENRSGGAHAMHGLLYNKSFTIIDQICTALDSAITLKYEYRGDEKGYPFSYDCIITWRLAKDCKLHVRTEIINKDEGLIPVQDGWHPYFKFSRPIDEIELEFQSKNIFEFDDELIPTGNKKAYFDFSTITLIRNLHFDSCFELDMQECQPLIVLRDTNLNVEVKIFPGNSYPYLQLYTPSDRSSIAIENISGISNGFNNGSFTTLESSQSAIFETSYQINLLTR